MAKRKPENERRVCPITTMFTREEFDFVINACFDSGYNKSNILRVLIMEIMAEERDKKIGVVA